MSGWAIFGRGVFALCVQTVLWILVMVGLKLTGWDMKPVDWFWSGAFFGVVIMSPLCRWVWPD